MQQSDRRSNIHRNVQHRRIPLSEIPITSDKKKISAPKKWRRRWHKVADFIPEGNILLFLARISEDDGYLAIHIPEKNLGGNQKSSTMFRHAKIYAIPEEALLPNPPDTDLLQEFPVRWGKKNNAQLEMDCGNIEITLSICGKKSTYGNIRFNQVFIDNIS